MEKIIQQRNYNLENCKFPSDLDSLLTRIYSARGIYNLEQISPSLQYLESYSDLKDINKAVNIIADAIIQNDKIMIVGDFDCDGATSTALVVLVLQKLQANVEYIVPSRFKFGYGLTSELVEEANKSNPNLIITVDNGISSIEGVKKAKELGMKVIITDHHLPAETVPDADAIVNPNQVGCEFKSKNIAGVGVVFYTLCALKNELIQSKYNLAKSINMAEYLDLVAIGTIADVVSLDQNNRIFAAQGIARIRQGKCRPGIKSLLKTCNNKDLITVNTSDIGFYLAPRLNAAGRLSDMSLGIELLLNDDIEITDQYAIELDQLNNQRKSIEAQMLEKALVIAKEQYNDNKDFYGITMYNASWHQGVIGILAARIKEQFYKPTIIFAQDSNDANIIKGSARSIEGYHLQQNLEKIHNENPGLIIKFGGHSMAAGLTIKLDDLERFTEIFNKNVAKHLSPELLTPVILTDGVLTSDQISLHTYNMIKSAAPWGKDFIEPCFEGVFILMKHKVISEKHLKVYLKSVDISDYSFEGFIYNVKDISKWQSEDLRKVKVVYTLEKTTFKNQDDLKLRIVHMQYDTASTNM